MIPIGIFLINWAVYIWRKKVLEGLIVASIVTLLVWFLIFGGILGNVINNTPSWYKTHNWLETSWDIKSSAFEVRNSGSFILWTANFEQHDYYYVFTYMGNNQWKKQRIRVEDTLISEVATQPRLLQYRQTRQCDWYWKWFLGLENFMDITTVYVLEVPKGTIVEKYTL